MIHTNISKFIHFLIKVKISFSDPILDQINLKDILERGVGSKN